jgi:hypothetical protein
MGKSGKNIKTFRGLRLPRPGKISPWLITGLLNRSMTTSVRGSQPDAFDPLAAGGRSQR